MIKGSQVWLFKSTLQELFYALWIAETKQVLKDALWHLL